MTSDFTYRELLAISEARSLVTMHADGSIQDDLEGLMQMFVGRLVMADCPRVIPHCASLLPNYLHAPLRTHLESLRSKSYFGEIILMAPGPTAEEQTAMQPIFRSVAHALEVYLNNPVAPDEVPDVGVDHTWVRLHEQPRQAGIRCKHEGCIEEAMTLSIMCPRHHYQMMSGKLPRGLE